MPTIFPEAERAPTDSMSCRIPEEAERSELIRRINGLADYFELPRRVPLRSAAIAYLGLCRMRQAHEAGKDKDIEKECERLLSQLQPDEGGKSVNCANFCGGAKFLNHAPLIANATSFYMPTIRSTKKRGAVLLAVGSAFDDRQHVLPTDDKWISGYLFR